MTAYGPSPTPTVHRRSRDDVDLSAGRGAILVPTATMKANSFDQLACAGEEYARDCVAERLGGLHVDDQINLRDLLHRLVGRLFALENAARIAAEHAIRLTRVGSVTHKTTGLNEVATKIDGGNRMAGRRRDELIATGDK